MLERDAHWIWVDNSVGMGQDLSPSRQDGAKRIRGIFEEVIAGYAEGPTQSVIPCYGQRVQVVFATHGRPAK